MGKGQIFIGTLFQAGETWAASLLLPNGALFQVLAIGAVEGGFASDKPLSEATEAQALIKAPDGSLWTVKAERVTYDQDAGT